MTVTRPNSEYIIHNGKHIVIETNFPRRHGITPPWFSFGVHLDFNKWHCVVFFWKFIITFGKKIDWGYPEIYGDNSGTKMQNGYGDDQ